MGIDMVLLRRAACCILAWALLGGPARGADAAPASPEPREQEATEAAEDAERDLADQVFDRFPGLDADRVMDFIHEELPDHARRIGALAERKRAEAVDYMSDLVNQAAELLEMRVNNPERYEQVVSLKRLEGQAERLGESIRRSQGADREEQEQALREVLSKAFEAKQELMQLDLRQMEAELDELRGLIEKRREHRDAIIGRRFSEMTGALDYLKW